MKKIFAVLTLLCIFAVTGSPPFLASDDAPNDGAIALTGCTPGQRQVAKDALDVVQTTCLIAHQFLPDADAMKACDVAEPFFDPARKVLSGARTASAQAVAGARMAGAGPCGSAGDGGAR